MNFGKWTSVLEFLKDKNEAGKYSICHCSQCNGTYVHHRAYINDDGDFVLSEDTLQKLLDEFKYSTDFDVSSDDSKKGFYFARHNSLGPKRYDEVIRSLVKHEYGEDDEY